MYWLLLLVISIQSSLCNHIPHKICIALPPSETCSSPPAVKYYYKPSAHSCVMFNYTGCVYIVENIFDSYNDCEDVCITGITDPDPTTPPPLPPPVTPEVTPPNTGDLCSLNYNVGVFKFGENGRRYYHNATVHQCQWFYYLGNGGNDNNFATEQECIERCIGVANIVPTTTITTTTTESDTTSHTTLDTTDDYNSFINTLTMSTPMISSIPVVSSSVTVPSTSSTLTSINTPVPSISSTFTPVPSISSTFNSISSTLTSISSTLTSINTLSVAVANTSSSSSSSTILSSSLSQSFTNSVPVNNDHDTNDNIQKSIIIYGTMLFVVLIILLGMLVGSLIICAIIKHNRITTRPAIQDSVKNKRPSSFWFWHSSGSSESSSNYSSPLPSCPSPPPPSRPCGPSSFPSCPPPPPPSRPCGPSSFPSCPSPFLNSQPSSSTSPLPLSYFFSTDPVTISNDIRSARTNQTV